MNTQRLSKCRPIEHGRLRVLARGLLREGKLPSENPLHEAVGASSGCVCALCYGAILEPAVEYTLEFVAREPGDSGRQTLHFHAFCHRIWDAERQAVKVKIALVSALGKNDRVTNCLSRGMVARGVTLA